MKPKMVLFISVWTYFVSAQAQVVSIPFIYFRRKW
jgi:hypothetical protein